MHLYASTHKVHSVARCILTHSHTVAVTALFITDAQCVRGWRSFDRYYLEQLLEKVVRRTFRANGTRRHIVAGTRIQPTDDTVEEEGDGEESDDDLDGM